jgi:arsenite methyltransferase
MKGSLKRVKGLKEYYGKIIKTKKDLGTNCCCSTDSFPPHVRKIVNKINPEILDKFYGCGSPIPHAMEGCTVVDLGCGTGRDVFIASALVGEKGKVIGVDMTDEQLEVAEKYKKEQAKKFGFSRSNVTFKKGYIENLKEIGIKDNSVDVVISNCAINLSADKRSVFSEILRILKPGGELFFSDIFASRRVPEKLNTDPVLVGECLGGAMYIEDFRRLLLQLGCQDYRVFSERKIEMTNPEFKAKLGKVDFYSKTVRAFKLDSLEDICEDYGQVAVYSGTMPDNPDSFKLDDHHVFETNKPMLVCGNSAAMVQETRYGKYFKVTGNKNVHYGPFPCGPAPKVSSNNDSGSCCC